MTKRTLQFATLLTGLLLAAAAQSQTLPAPLFEGLGQGHHPITTQSRLAQRYFDQGLALLYAFNHTEAIRSFQAVTRLDPECAMGHWGIAFAYGPNINKPLDAESAGEAWAALEQALKFKTKAGPRERAYIEALENRYRAEPAEDRSDLDQAYAGAMRDVATQYPDDLDAATLFADALMNTMPWDYWTGDLEPKPATVELLDTLRAVLLRDPHHAGANHLYIHAVEAGPNPELGLPSADRLGRLAPKAGHLVHMPSHIYVRVGQYHDAAEVNALAVRVDEEYITNCRVQGFYPGLYYPHNLNFLWYSTSILGRSKDCLETARTVARFARDVRCGSTEVIEAPRLRFLPQLTLLHFGRWDEVLNERPPADRDELLFDRAMWHYCRALAFRARGQIEAAAAEAARLKAIAESEEAKTLNNPFFPATAILKVARHLAAGKIAGAQGDQDKMITQLEEAVAAQDALPYMEPPFWHYPVRQSLAAAWLESGEAAKAEQVFRESLEEAPRHPWSLFGLAESLRRQGKTEAADSVQREFKRAWQHADVELDLAWF